MIARLVIVTIAPEIVRAFEAPDTAAGLSGVAFFVRIGTLAVAGPVPGPAFTDHVVGEALAASLALPNTAVIAVFAVDIATNCSFADEVLQGEGSLLVDIDRAAPGTALGRVEAAEPDALTVDFDCVPIDDGGGASELDLADLRDRGRRRLACSYN